MIYDELIGCFFDVFEVVDCDMLFDGLCWCFDCCEMILDVNIVWVVVLGGGIIV